MYDLQVQRYLACRCMYARSKCYSGKLLLPKCIRGSVFSPSRKVLGLSLNVDLAVRGVAFGGGGAVGSNHKASRVGGEVEIAHAQLGDLHPSPQLG